MLARCVMMATSKQKRVAVRIQHKAHIDEAYLKQGFVSKNVQLVVDASDATQLVADHTYLEQVTED